MEEEFYFEEEYADELEALQDLENDIDEEGPRSKKTLDFTTPSSNRTRPTNLNDSLPTPLDSSGLELTPEVKQKSNRPNGQIKRNSSAMFEGLSDEEYAVEDEGLPVIEPRKKKARQEAVVENGDDDFEITPPPSPDEISAVKRQNRTQAAKRTTPRVRPQQQDDDLWSRRRVHHHVPDSDFMTIRGLDGHYMYMSLLDEEKLDEEVAAVAEKGQSFSMLGTSVLDLKAQIEEKRTRKVLEESRRITEYINSQDGSGEAVLQNGELIPSETEDQSSPAEALWVTRYSPSCYTDLLSDESTNRTMLRWLKLWDHMVFGKEKKKKEETKDKKKQEAKNPFPNKYAPEVEEEYDNHGRPNQKVALLCGPPGLGKTTLAHVIARHAGYNVVEMNASDDRSAEAFRTQLEASTQMKAVMGADPRPNCLIIDEIDGSPQAAINVLISLIKRTGEPTGKKKKKEGDLLRRPIICICNDLYAPALRQLRQVALVVHFPPTLSSRLAGRLMEISRREKLRTDMTAIHALCEKADNDIRSCLNTLQFVSGRQQELTLQMVGSVSVGQKDAHKSLFSVWQSLFQMPRPKRKRYINPHDRGNMNFEDDHRSALENNLSMTARFHNALMLAEAAGEREKVMQGLHENYLEAKVKDPHLQTMMIASDWLCFVDLLGREILHSQNYILMRYTTYLPVIFHLLFASNHPNKINYPHSQYEMVTKQSRSSTLVSSLMSEVAPSVRKNLNVVVTVTEVLPPLIDIIQPTLRPVNTQLYSTREKADLSHLIHIMMAYNLTYHQERTVEGQYIYTLDPHVDELAKFPGMKPHKQLTYAAKQLIAREIELERMRKSEGEKEVKKEVKKASIKTKQEGQTKEKELPNHMRQKLEAKAIKEDIDKPLVDFFGRKVERKEVDVKKAGREEPKKEINTEIWFHFKEGFTNAVRKTVRIQDLM